MYKYIIGSILAVVFLSGCGTTDGECCKTIEYKSKSVTPESSDSDTVTPYIVKTGDPVPNPENTSSIGLGDLPKPPVAIITPGTGPLKASEPVTFSCDKSYDQDEDGESIVICEWKFVCHKKDGYDCDCVKKGSPDLDIVVSPHADSEYMTATLTVTDNEGQTNTTTTTYEVN